jgi:hypothetical protein
MPFSTSASLTRRLCWTVVESSATMVQHRQYALVKSTQAADLRVTLSGPRHRVRRPDPADLRATLSSSPQFPHILFADRMPWWSSRVWPADRPNQRWPQHSPHRMEMLLSSKLHGQPVQ